MAKALARAAFLAAVFAVALLAWATPARAVLADWSTVNLFLDGVVVQEAATLPDQDPTAAPLTDLEVASGTTVGDAVISGTFTVGDVTCSGWALAGALTLSSAAQATQIDTTLALADIHYTCTGTASWTSLRVYDGFTGPSDTTETGTSAFTFETTAADLALDLAWVLTTGRRSGVDPDRPGSLQVQTCALSANIAPADVTLDTPPSSGDITTVAQVLTEGVVGHILACSVLEDLADEATSSLDTLFTALIDLADDTAAAPSDFVAAEADLLAAISDAQEALIIDFSQASTAKLILEVVNRVLGSSGSGANSTAPLVNEYAENPYTVDVAAIASLQDPDALFNGTVDIGDQIFVSGLDTFVTFDAFTPVSGRPYSLKSDFDLEALVLETAADIEVVAAAASSASGRVTATSALVLHIDTLAIALSNFTFETGQAVAADKDFAEDVTVNEINNSPFACIAPSLYRIDLASIEVDDVANVDALEVSGFQDTALNAVQPDIAELVNLILTPTLASDLPALTRGLRPVFEDTLNEALVQLTQDECVSTVENISATELVDFGSAGFAEVLRVLNETVHDVDEPTIGLNQVLRELALSQGNAANTLVFNSSSLLTAALDFGDSGVLNATVKALRFYNADTFVSAAFMQPIGASPTRRATNTFTLGRAGLAFAVEADVSLLGTGDLDTDESDTVRFEFNDLAVFVDADINVLAQRFAALDVDTLPSPFCLASALDFEGENLAIKLRDLAVSFAAVAFDCYECTLTPGEKQNVASDISTSKDIAVQFALDKLRSGNGNIALNRAFRDLASVCDDSLSRPAPVLEASSDIGPTVLLYGAGVGAALTLAAMTLVVCAGTCGCCSCGAPGSETRIAAKALEHVFPGQQQQQQAGGQSRLAQYAGTTKSLATRSSTSLALRFAVVASALLSFVIFITAAMSDMANVVVRVSEDGGAKQLEIDQLYTLTMPGVISQFFDVGAPMLGVAIVIFTGIWPYAHLLLVLFCFFAPMSILGDKWRGRFLYGLDFLAKWVLVDQYLILILVVVFDIRLSEADLETFGLTGTSARFSFVPGWGLMGFLLGVMVLAVTSLLVMHQHVRVTSPSRASAKRTGIPRPAIQFLRRKTRLTKYVFHPVLDSGRELQMKMGRTSLMLAVAGAMGCIGLVVVSLFLPSVTFTYLGAGGKGLGIIASGRDRVSFAVLDFVQTLQAQGTTTAEIAGGAFIQVFFLIAVVLIPVLQQVFLIVSYLAPLTLRERRMIWFTLECLMFCCTLEVFCIAAVFAALNVGIFVPFVTEKLCLQIDAFINDFVVPVGLLDEKNNSCFSAEGSFEIGFYLMILAAVLGIANVYFMSGPNRLIIEEEEEVLDALCDGASMAEAASVAGTAYESNVDCWFPATRRHIKTLHRAGLVLVRAPPPAARQQSGMHTPPPSPQRSPIPLPGPAAPGRVSRSGSANSRPSPRPGMIPLPEPVRRNDDDRDRRPSF